VPPENPVGASAAEVESLVDAARTALLFRLTPQPLLAGAAFSVLIAIALWPTPGAGLALVAWLAARLVIAGLRLADCLAFTHRPEPPHLGPRRKRFVVLLCIDAVSWSSAGLLFVGAARPPLGLALLASLAVVAAVSLYSLASHARFAALFFSLVLLPNAVSLMAMRAADPGVAAAAFMVLEGLLLLESRGLEARLVEMLRLRHEIAQIAAERQRALLLAEHSSSVKSRFLATLSHELRTPLNGILGMAQLLAAGSLQADQEQPVQAILTSARHLQGVIGDLLDQSGIESGRLAITRTRMSLRDAVHEVAVVAEPLVRQAGMRFELDELSGLPPWIESDPVRVKQIVYNLITNAVKFTRAGRISLSVRCVAGLATIRVQDTGVGIAQDQIERIFDAFEQADTPADGSHRSGLGLGLTISRELARALGGELSCTSTPGAGSTFDFTLPVHEAAPPFVPTPVVAAVGGGGAAGCVLVVEDDPVNALVARTILEREGLRVEVVTDGQAACDCLARGRYDLVLMDCQLPILSGWDATAHWRAQEQANGGTRVPIVALTANSIEGDRERCLAAGMDDYLSKPFDMAALLATVRRHLGT